MKKLSTFKVDDSAWESLRVQKSFRPNESKSWTLILAWPGLKGLVIHFFVIPVQDDKLIYSGENCVNENQNLYEIAMSSK